MNQIYLLILIKRKQCINKLQVPISEKASQDDLSFGNVRVLVADLFSYRYNNGILEGFQIVTKRLFPNSFHVKQI